VPILVPHHPHEVATIQENTRKLEELPILQGKDRGLLVGHTEASGSLFSRTSRQMVAHADNEKQKVEKYLKIERGR